MELAGNPVDLHQRFVRARAAFPGPVPLALLEMGEDHTHLIHGIGDEPQGMVQLRLGYRSLADTCFSHWPLAPVELERAIELAEDQLMLATPPLRDATVVATDDILRRLLADSGAGSQQRVSMTTGEIERLFQRMASVSLGRPLSDAGSVTNRYEAAALLLLRELMHHWGVAGIALPVVHQ